MSEPNDIDRPWEDGFEAELTLQRRAESMLMLRGATILLFVTGVVAIRSMLF